MSCPVEISSWRTRMESNSDSWSSSSQFLDTFQVLRQVKKPLHGAKFSTRAQHNGEQPASLPRDVFPQITQEQKGVASRAAHLTLALYNDFSDLQNSSKNLLRLYLLYLAFPASCKGSVSHACYNKVWIIQELSYPRPEKAGQGLSWNPGVPILVPQIFPCAFIKK